MHPLLSAHDVRKFYGNFAALTGVNLELRRGDRRALIGPNGAGKSTFIGCLAGQIKGANGRIIFKGHDIAHMQPSALARLGIGRTFQISRTFLSMTVFENMMAACAIARNQWLSLGLGTYSKLNETVCEMLRDVGMLDQRTAVVRDLSLGDRKRLEFGMALIGDPDLILLDEPTAGMGMKERHQLMDLVVELVAREHKTLLFVEHDIDVVFRIASNVTVMVGGSVFTEGTPAEIAANEEVQRVYLGGHR